MKGLGPDEHKTLFDFARRPGDPRLSLAYFQEGCRKGKPPADITPYIEQEEEEEETPKQRSRGPKVIGGGAPPDISMSPPPITKGRTRVRFDVPDPEPEEPEAGTAEADDYSKTDCFVSFESNPDDMHGFVTKTSRTTGKQYIYDTKAVDECAFTHKDVAGRRKSYGASNPKELYVDAYDDIDTRKFEAPAEVRESFGNFLDVEFEALAPRVRNDEEEQDAEVERVDVGGGRGGGKKGEDWDTLRALSPSYKQYLLKSVNVELGFKGLYQWLQPICNIADVEKRPVQSLGSILFACDLNGGVPYGFDTYVNDIPIRDGEQMISVAEEDAAISFRLRVKLNSMQDDEQAEAIEGVGVAETVICVGRDLQDWTCDFLSCVITLYATNDTRTHQARRCAQLLPAARAAHDIQVAIISAKFETML